MKEGWKYMKLGEVCDFQNGFAFKSNLFADKGIGVVRISDIQNGEVSKEKMTYVNPKSIKEDLSSFIVRPNDILIAMSGGTTGKLGINKTKETFFQNQRVGLFREHKEVLNHTFLYYFLCTKSEESLKIAAGAAQPNLSTIQIKQFQIPVPPLSDQQRIVSYLDAEFTKIEALKANAEKQLQAAKDLFQAALKELLTPKEGWKGKELKTICQVINGRAYKQDEMLQVGKYRLLRVGNFFTNDKWYYSDLELENDKYCCSGDLLYAWSASFGPRIWDGEKVIYHYHIWKLVCSDCIDKHYLFYWLESDIFKTQVMQDLHGATMNHITKTIMETTIVWFPCLDTQKIITARLDALSANVKALQTNYTETITLCNDLKQALLKKVFEEDG